MTQEAQLARMSLKAITPYLARQEEALHARIVGLYRTGKLAEGQLWGYVGELSAIRQLFQSLETQAKKLDI